MTVFGVAARQERGDVVRVEVLGERLVEVSVRLPHLAATALPGQFAQLRCGDGVQPLLRRPFSVAWAVDDICSFVVAPVGEGTRRLCALAVGDALDVLGPLGRGYRLPDDASNVICVAGGVGCAPFPLLAARAREGGGAVTVLSGATTERRLYPAERYQRGDAAIRVVEATDDGSRGWNGTVVDLVASAMSGGASVYGCGPNPMLAALAASLSGGAGLHRAEVSLEAPMGCGFGVCLGCVIPVHSGDAAAPASWALCCTDGPVLDITQVDWERLMALPRAGVA